MKILVVEDGQQAAGSLARTLCRAAPGSEYLCAPTAADALRLARRGPLDAAFLDLEMPGMGVRIVWQHVCTPKSPPLHTPHRRTAALPD